jgi:hypothetical protein
VLIHIAFYASTSSTDAGAAAYVWQILMLAQIPALALFSARWLRKARRPAFQVLTLHGATIVLSVAAALAPLYFLHL